MKEKSNNQTYYNSEDYEGRYGNCPIKVTNVIREIIEGICYIPMFRTGELYILQSQIGMNLKYDLTICSGEYAILGIDFSTARKYDMQINSSTLKDRQQKLNIDCLVLDIDELVDHYMSDTCTEEGNKVYSEISSIVEKIEDMINIAYDLDIKDKIEKPLVRFPFITIGDKQVKEEKEKIIEMLVELQYIHPDKYHDNQYQSVNENCGFSYVYTSFYPTLYGEVIGLIKGYRVSEDLRILEELYLTETGVNSMLEELGNIQNYVLRNSVDVEELILWDFETRVEYARTNKPTNPKTTKKYIDTFAQKKLQDLLYNTCDYEMCEFESEAESLLMIKTEDILNMTYGEFAEEVFKRGFSESQKSSLIRKLIDALLDSAAPESEPIWI